jgi:hypothetical protein
MFKEIMISLALTAVCYLAWATAGGQTKDPLLFPGDNFMVENKTVKTYYVEYQSSLNLQGKNDL